jgi:hypothetical protein
VTRQFGLSKSRITAFEQCPKKLWLSVHRPDLAVIDESAQMRFDAGHETGAAACSLYPDGAMIMAEPDLAAALAETRRLLDAGHDKAIFEGTFSHDGVLVRVDIMEPKGAGAWRVAEVKSTTAIKDYHVGDLATQIWVLRECGVEVASAVVRHIDNSFVLAREGEFAGLFADASLDDVIAPVVAGRAAIVAAARATLAGPEPTITVGAHCSTPFACELVAYCGGAAEAAPEWPVSLLPRTGRQLAEEWAGRAIFDLRDIPEGAFSNEVHNRVHRATLTGEVFHNRAGVLAATKDWGFPRAYLDFETIAFAVPRWIGARPYQAVPFQFSCHIETADGTMTHHEFISIDGSDPRRACAIALLACCGEGQSEAVIAYNASFERRCILDLAAACPDLADGLLALAGRLVDLLPVTRMNYYHRDQRGSWSIKAVLPTIAAELDYASLEIKDGGNAQKAYLEAIASATGEMRQSAIAAALLAYCRRDTEAMIVLLRHLEG